MLATGEPSSQFGMGKEPTAQFPRLSHGCWVGRKRVSPPYGFRDRHLSGACPAVGRELASGPVGLAVVAAPVRESPLAGAVGVRDEDLGLPFAPRPGEDELEALGRPARIPIVEAVVRNRLHPR